MRLLLLATTVALAAVSLPAMGQRSLFDQPVTNPSDAGPAPAAPPATTAPAAPPPVTPAAPASPPPVAAAPRAPAPAAEPAATEEPPAQPQRRATPRKPRGPVPARALAVFNGSPIALTALDVSQDGRSARLKQPLAPGKRTRLVLPAFKSCEVTVRATFDGQAAGEPSQVDICKEKSLNFRE